MSQLTDQDTLQAITDALGGIAIALSKQLDAKRLTTDLRALADEAMEAGNGPSAGLIGEIARAVEARTTQLN